MRIVRTNEKKEMETLQLDPCSASISSRSFVKNKKNYLLYLRRRSLPSGSRKKTLNESRPGVREAATSVSRQRATKKDKNEVNVTAHWCPSMDTLFDAFTNILHRFMQSSGNFNLVPP